MDFLITKRYLCDNTPVPTTQNDNELKTALTDTHYFDILFLGIPLTDLFTNHVVSGATLSPVQTQLFNMVQYYIAYRVYYHLTFNIFKVNNAGVTQAQDSVTLENLKDVRNQIDIKTAVLKRRILEFIERNKAALPQAAPEADVTLTNDPLNSLGVVWSPNVERYFY